MTVDVTRLLDDLEAAHPAATLVAISRWIDSANAHRHPETNLWSRVSKAAEEGGEAMDALRGYLGENPRKGVTGTLDEVVEELLDTAVAALGAVEHIRDHDGQALRLLVDKIRRVADRAALPAPLAGHGTDEETNHA